MSYRSLYLFELMVYIQTGYGLSNHSLEGRIVKGYKVDISEYPHSVFLHFKHTVPSGCGGSLILDHMIITAAHCLNELTIKGTINAFFGDSIPIKARVVRRVIRYRIHPRYDPKKGRYNLGIAFLNYAVPLGNYIKKIPIAYIPPKPKDNLFSSGWGKQVPDLVPDYSEMRHLKVSKQRVISDRECQNFTGFRISGAYWCTVSVNGYHYHGDAGNGLVSRDQFLVGVVSYMINEATIYSDVIRQGSWIFGSTQSLHKEHCLEKVKMTAIRR